METFWETILTKLRLRKKKHKTYKENVDYAIIPLNDDRMAINILLPSYKDIVICYGKVSVEENGGLCILHFDYDIVDPATYDPEEIKQDTLFHVILGDILTELMLKKE
jgi:hypothetical protein